MRFCCACGAAVTLHIPPGDNLLRYVCTGCATVHYQNPKLIVGCIPEWESQILLCKRAIQPRYGFWTFPAGFMENEETTAQGAARESFEEANAHVAIGELLTLINLPTISQVYLIFRAQLLNRDVFPGNETSAVALFHETEIPWSILAFNTVRLSLENYFADRRQGNFRLHIEDIYQS